ncbi:hypothetical protein [Aurantiacibacter sp. D1-12]|uniref:hypothetical protein n=1 Tax=Aurantiacibacter sp. D1-12 TaxID=2993658 RepID=UPI00237CAAAF|nr:hypothetical protein [Aurantiacibacter sp. D1-12]MDE1467183.1 hypothetical protein [Aurantiacibacter sp. D1-12]
MTGVKGKDVLPPQREGFAEAYEELRASESIQFTEVPTPEVEPPPDWLVQLLDALGSLFAPIARLLVAIWPVLMWVLIIGGAALLLIALVRLIQPDFLRRRKKGEAGEEEWSPDQGEALALLEEADRLASEGRYDEATHLLLKRSVGQIAAARPDLVEPSSTARELSAETRLPEGARNAFSIIATRVERSLFALTKLNLDDWQAAREAYAEFALQQKALAA